MGHPDTIYNQIQTKYKMYKGRVKRVGLLLLKGDESYQVSSTGSECHGVQRW